MNVGIEHGVWQRAARRGCERQRRHDAVRRQLMLPVSKSNRDSQITIL
jgi:hypothetical protein